MLLKFLLLINLTKFTATLESYNFAKAKTLKPIL